MARTGKILTKRMIAFVQAVAAQPEGAVNGTKAAKLAGYSEKGAKVAASEMLRDYRIIEAVRMARAGQLDACKYVPRPSTGVKPPVARQTAPAVPPPPPPPPDPVQPVHASPWPFPPPGGPLPPAMPEQVEDFLAEAPKAITDSVEFLTRVMNHPKLDIEVRKDAAKALLPYQHAKKEGSKKQEAEAKARAAGNKFAGTPAPPVPLRAVVKNG
jgi:phage terminase small subunit